MGKIRNQIFSHAHVRAHTRMHTGNTDHNVMAASGSVQRGGEL